MPKWCAAINCKNDSSLKSDLSFFKFPTEPSLKKQWLVNLRREDYEPSAHATVCSAHFKLGCFDQFFDRRKQLEGTTTSAKRKLLPGACPTEFSFATNPSRPAKSPIKRGALEKRRRRKILFSDPFLPKKKKSQETVVPVRPAPVILPCQPNESETAEQLEDVELQATRTPTTSATCQTDVMGIDNDNIYRKPSVTFATGTMTRPRQIRHFKVQCRPQTQTNGTNMVDMSIQCDMPKPTEIDLEGKSVDEDCVSEDEDIDGGMDDSDDEWLPEMEDEDEDSCVEDGNILRENQSSVHERKFVVFESCLLQLLAICMQCFQSCTVTVKKAVGSFVHVRSICSNGHIRDWKSQTYHQGMPLGNILTACSILFSGSSPSKVLSMFRHMRLQMFSLRTYFRIQSAYLCPAVKSVWNEHNRQMLRERQNRNVKLGGDGRCCSAGHTAKYGSYSLMDLETSTVIETQLVQTNEVKNSTAMELEGLKRCWEHLVKEQVKVEELVTDRHVQVKKYMRSELPKVKHHFDVWHMAKGVKKKLEAIGKKKGLEVVGRWAASISNHMYWCAASSVGNGPLVEAKWVSVINHICNVHDHPQQLFPKCEHGELTDREWLKPGSRAIKNIEAVIMKTPFLKDVQKLAPGYVLPPFISMRIARCQARTKTGDPMFGIAYVKSNQGKPVAKEVKVPQTFGYVDQLIDAVLERREKLPNYTSARREKAAVTTTAVASKYRHDEKQEVIQRHVSRFN